MIKIILPISRVDVNLAGLLGDRMVKLGGTKERQLVITTCWEDNQAFSIEQFCDYLRPNFKTVELYVMPDVPEGEGWPAAANFMFYQSMAWVAQNGNKDPIYYLEADNFPLRAHWLEALDMEYAAGGKPYMGVVQPSHYLNRETGEVSQQGEHMVGTGIYPADFMERSYEVHTLTNEPWDLACASEIVGECHNTDLIWHAWNTWKYRLVEGELIGKDKGDAAKRLGVSETTGLKSRGGVPVSRAARVIHGCKDNSLYKIDFER